MALIDQSEAETMLRDHGKAGSAMGNGNKPGRYSFPDSQSYNGYRPYGPVPTSVEQQAMECVWFYHLQFQSNGKLASRIYKAKISSQKEAEKKIKGWIEDGSGKNPEFVSHDPEAVAWNSPGYIVFLLDNPGWQWLENEKGTQNRSIHFKKFKESGKGGKKYRSNKSFFNSKTWEINGHRCLSVENHHSNPDNKGKKRRKGDTRNDYKYDLLFNVGFDPKVMDDNGAEKKLVMVIDPGGHNTGPDNDN